MICNAPFNLIRKIRGTSHIDNQQYSPGVHNVTPTKPGTPRCQQKQDNSLTKSLYPKTTSTGAVALKKT